MLKTERDILHSRVGHPPFAWRTLLQPPLRFASSLSSLLGIATAAALSLVSEAAVETQANRSEDVGGADANEQAPGPHTSHGATAAQRWHERELTVLLDSSLFGLPVPPEALVHAAFAAWADTGAPLPIVHFEYGSVREASLKPDGKNSILVAPLDFKGHETDLAITIGFSNASTGEISEADIVINQKHLFEVVADHQAKASAAGSAQSVLPSEQDSCNGTLDPAACAGSYDLQNVLTHEVGHFLGLGENYDDTRATMFSCTSACETHKRDLNEADIEEILSLYDEGASVQAAGCAGVQIGGQPEHLRLSHYGIWSALVLLGLVRRRRAS